ncbi:MAG TPA: VanZ family protein, partial [Vicinamibacterales bacterium]
VRMEGVSPRHSYALLAVALMAFTVYVSLLPFRLEPVAWDVAWTHFARVMTSWPRRVPRANFLANLLLFVPIGFGLAGAWLADRPRRRFASAALMALPLSLLVSFGAEFAQEFAPRRVVSVLDVVAQALGCGVGLVLWAAGGQAFTTWMRESRQRVHHDRLTRVLVAYAALWALANLAPFDITLDVARLGRRLRDGSISVVPFAAPWTPRLWWDVVVTAVSSVPLGLAAMFTGVGTGGGRRSALASVGLGVVGLAGMELAHVFIRSHAADATDLLIGAVGVAGGAWVGLRLRPDGPAHTAGGLGWELQWVWAGVVGWGLMLAGYHWQPFDFGLDDTLLRQKVARISLVPFAGYRSGSDLAALNTLIAKIGMAIPLGAIAAVGLPRVLRPVRAVACLLAAGTVFGVIELGQFFLPSRVPDLTDVWLGVASSAGGLWLGRWLRSGYDARDAPRR